jgi:Fe-S-cluster containining protein
MLERLNLHCVNCGICCEETMMELSVDDIKRLEDKGFRLEDFTVQNDSITQIRNVGGFCYFYNRYEKNCQIYEDKPIGCCIYPVVYRVNVGTIAVDELCPMGKTISKHELMTKGKTLDTLLKKIDRENQQTFRVG